MTPRGTAPLFPSGVVALALAGCGGKTLDIGSDSVSQPGCTPSVLYADDFSSDTLENYEFPFGADYAVVDGVLQQVAQPGIALPDAVDRTAVIRPELLAGASDYVVEADGRIRDRTDSQGLFGLAFRAGPAGEHYSFLWNGNSEHAVPHWQVEKSYDLELDYSYLGGGFGTGEESPAYALGTWVHLRVSVTGTRFRGQVDVHDGRGLVTVYDVTDASDPFASGSVGFRSGWLYGTNFIEFDNFTITSSCG